MNGGYIECICFCISTIFQKHHAFSRYRGHFKSCQLTLDMLTRSIQTQGYNRCFRCSSGRAYFSILVQVAKVDLTPHSSPNSKALQLLEKN